MNESIGRQYTFLWFNDKDSALEFFEAIRDVSSVSAAELLDYVQMDQAKHLADYAVRFYLEETIK